MSPEAAGLFAQIDAALLIALAVQGRPPETPDLPTEPGDEDFPRRLWLSSGREAYGGGLLAAIFSLAIALESVRYDKALGAWTSTVVMSLTLLTSLAFFAAAMGGAIGTLRHLRQRLRLVLLTLAGFIAFCIWLVTFAPSFWPWE